MGEIHISVIVPTCNRPESLIACLQSLSSRVQTFDASAYEIVVTDDGITDFFTDLMARIEPSVNYVHGPRRGPAANRNNGAAHARGKFLAFIDDDCVPSPQWLAALFEQTQKGHLVVEGRTTTDYPLNGPFVHAPINETGGYLWSCNFLIERALFERLGGFDDRFPYPFLEDVDFRTRLLASGQKFVFAENAVVLHPQRPVVDAARQARQFESYFWYSSKHGKTLAESGLSLSAYGRVWAKMLLKSRSVLEAARVLCYVSSLCFMLLWLMPGWSRKYKSL